MKNSFIVGIFSLLAGCTSVQKETLDLPTAKPPQLWSHHKVLDIHVGACALKGLSALKSLGFTQVVKNENYIYGNFHNNRVAVKCVSRGAASFVYLAVAGPNKEIVEKLRNEVAWKM